MAVTFRYFHCGLRNHVFLTVSVVFCDDIMYNTFAAQKEGSDKNAKSRSQRKRRPRRSVTSF